MSYPGYRDGGQMPAANIPAMPQYDKFPMRNAPIYHLPYRSQPAPYKAGGEVIRPQSTIKGRNWKGNYDNFNKHSYPDFYPIYGPQGDKRPYHYPPNQDRQRNGYRQPLADRADPNRPGDPQVKARGQPTYEHPEIENKKEPRTYYNPPDTRDRYVAQEPSVQKEQPKEHKVVPKENDKEEKEHNLSYKDAEKPVRKMERQDPVFAELHQSKLKRRPAEAKKNTRNRAEETKENRPQKERPDSRQEIEQLQKKENKNKEEPLGHKNRESPDTQRRTREPVYTNLHQSKLKQKEEPSRQKQETVQPPQREHKQEIQQRETTEDRKPAQQAPTEQQEEPLGHKGQEYPDSNRNNKEPVILELHRSKLRQEQPVQKRQEPMKSVPKDEQKENREKKHEDKEDIQKEDKDIPHDRSKENPEVKRDKQEPVLLELHRSQLKQADPVTKKQEPVKSDLKEDKTSKHEDNKKMEHPDRKKEKDKTQRDEDTESSIASRDQEHPLQNNGKQKPIIRDLHKSNLKEKYESPDKKQEPINENPSKEEEKKKPKDMKKNKKAEKKQVEKEIEVVEVPREEGKTDNAPTENYPKEESKEEPESAAVEEEPNYPYAYSHPPEEDKTHEDDNDKPQRKKGAKKAQKPHRYGYTPEEEEEEERRGHKNNKHRGRDRTPETRNRTTQTKEVTEEDEVIVAARRRAIKDRDKSTVRARYYEQADGLDDLCNGLCPYSIIPPYALVDWHADLTMVNLSKVLPPANNHTQCRFSINSVADRQTVSCRTTAAH